MTETAKRDLLVVACAISAGIHAALAPEHFEESMVTGAGFAASAALLAVLVVALRRPRHAALASGLTATTLAALIVLYAVAAATGIPVLHPDVDPVDRIAVATKAVELVGLALALDLLRHPHREGATA
jgi:drug/metabolite transporter (DMT)-like permease